MRGEPVLVIAADGDDHATRPLRDAMRARDVPVATRPDEARLAVLIASPASAASPIVEDQLLEWSSPHERLSRLVIVLVAGELEWSNEENRFDPVRTSALAPSAQRLFPTRPLWLDARDGASAALVNRLVRSLEAGAPSPPSRPRSPRPSAPAAVPRSVRRRAARWVLPVTVLLGALVVGVIAVVLVSGGGNQRPSATTPAPGTTTLPTTGPPTTPVPIAPGAHRSSPLWYLAAGLGIGLVVGLLLAWWRHRRNVSAPAEVSPGPVTAMAWPPPVPPTGARPTVFISHDVDADHALAVRLAGDLRSRLDIWIAPESILPGDPWLTSVERGLKASTVFLALLSTASVSSPWVVKEIQAAMELEVRNRLRLVPVQIDSCDVPLLLGTYQILQLAAGYRQVVDQTVLVASTAGRS